MHHFHADGHKGVARGFIKNGHKFKRQRRKAGADEIPEQHHAPEPQQQSQVGAGRVVHHRQDRRHGVFGKKLLARHDDDNKAEGVAEAFQQKAARNAFQMHMENPLRQQRRAHRQPGGDSRPEQRHRIALQLFFAILADVFVNGHRTRRQGLFIHFYLFTAFFLFAFDFQLIRVVDFFLANLVHMGLLSDKGAALSVARR